MPVPVDVKGEGAGKSKRRGHKQNPRTSHIDVDSQLLEAVAQSRLRVVRRLIDSGANPNHQGGPNNCSPLMLSLEVENEGPGEAIFNLLLHKGVEVNLQDTLGRTALMYAVLAGQERAVEQLLENGADVSSSDQDGNNALCYAAMAEHEAALGCTQLLCKAVLDKGGNIDHQNVRGLSPLLIAAQAGHLDVARVLVEGGASLSKRDVEHFMTAQDWMRKMGHFSDTQLDFLSPTKKRRTHYRQERIKKGIKTLTDFLPDIDDSRGAESPNVFAVCSRDVIKEDHTPSFPSIQMQAAASSSHKSMFDILSKKSLEEAERQTDSIKKSTSSGVHFSSLTSVKMDIYKSPYLSKRQSLLHRNTRSEGYHSGALAPLSSPTHHPPGNNKANSKLNSKNAKLPPITKK